MAVQPSPTAGAGNTEHQRSNTGCCTRSKQLPRCRGAAQDVLFQWGQFLFLSYHAEVITFQIVIGDVFGVHVQFSVLLAESFSHFFRADLVAHWAGRHTLQGVYPWALASFNVIRILLDARYRHPARW
jgi:hypothetical protein